MYLAVSGAGLATVREIAKRYGVSKNRLAKVAWELGCTGFVETARGKGGGLRLARPLETISVGAVARHIERTIPLAECFPEGAGACRIVSSCVYRHVLVEAEEAFFVVLDRHSVRDLVEATRRSVLFSCRTRGDRDRGLRN